MVKICSEIMCMATKLFSFLFDDSDDGCHVVTKVVMFDRGEREHQQVVLSHKMCQCHNDDVRHRWWCSHAMCCMNGILLLTKVESWPKIKIKIHYWIFVTPFYFFCILANFCHKKNVAWSEWKKNHQILTFGF